MKHLTKLTAKHPTAAKILKSKDGAIGYILAWMLGVPVSLLFLIFLIRGH